MKSLRKAISRRLFPDREVFRAPIQDARGRRAAWLDFLLVDFGILRLFWKNRRRFARDAFRMNQPYPADIAWAKRHGVKTILTARHDPRHGGHALVGEAAARHKLAYAVFPLLSRDPPSKESLLDAPDFLRRLEAPVMIHCKSGADRAGFLAALWLVFIEGASVRAARKELSLRHLHIRASRTGILDAVFDAYLAAHPDEAKPFIDWVRDEYDPERLRADFHAGRFADFVDRIILRRE